VNLPLWIIAACAVVLATISLLAAAVIFGII